MKLQNVSNEKQLRQWLTEVTEVDKSISLQWVEPSEFGSTVGACDVVVKHQDQRVDLELKYLYLTRTGIKFTVRPAQRRYHRMTMKRGGKTSLLAVMNSSKRLFLVRGDKVPLRDYASYTGSGVLSDADICVTVAPVDNVVHLKQLLFYNSDYWR